MDTKTYIAKLVDHLGGPTAAARALGVSQPTAYAWWKGSHGMSVKSALKAEVVTSGEFEAVKLCPDLNPTTAVI